MRFEYDAGKSRTNKLKHGIDFEEAQKLWDDHDRLEIPARDSAEDRAVVIGKIHGKHWSAIITCRAESMRLISVRRSRKEEVALYENLET